jgi:hypothetical protein
MSRVSEEIDRLTQTFSTDQAYCDALFNSQSASIVAELLLSHLWANTALPHCYNALSTAVATRFGARSEMAEFWNLILLDGINRDLRLVPYHVLRGIVSEASTALRRAFEHIGVLTHIWADPQKVDALDDTESKRYSQTFRWESDSRKVKALKALKTSKRFAAMKLGSVATLLYETLSKVDVHGGTSRRFFSYFTELS